MFQNLLLIALALLLVVLNGAFVAAEFALVKLRQTRITELRNIFGWRGRVLAAVHQHLDAYLSACQLGITLASLGLGWVGEPAFAHILESAVDLIGIKLEPKALAATAFVLAFSLISFLHIVVGELAPKSFALRRPETVSLLTAPFLFGFYRLMYPFIVVLNAGANVVLRAFRLSGGNGHESSYTSDELRTILRANRMTLETAEREVNALATHALELPSLTVGELMRPIREMVSCSTQATRAEVRRMVQQHQYSRYPLLDAHDQVVGILHVKDLFEILLTPPEGAFISQLYENLSLPLRAREDDSAAELLRRFRRGTSHFALVFNNSFELSGFLTLEDVLESLIGQINDEHENSRHHQIERQLVKLSDQQWLARGDTPIYLAERTIGREISGNQGPSTISGLLMETLHRVPVAGDVINVNGLQIKAVRVRGLTLEVVQLTDLIAH